MRKFPLLDTPSVRKAATELRNPDRVKTIMNELHRTGTSTWFNLVPEEGWMVKYDLKTGLLTQIIQGKIELPLKQIAPFSYEVCSPVWWNARD